jgi:hypothetical protein
METCAALGQAAFCPGRQHGEVELPSPPPCFRACNYPMIMSLLLLYETILPDSPDGHGGRRAGRG